MRNRRRRRKPRPPVYTPRESARHVFVQGLMYFGMCVVAFPAISLLKGEPINLGFAVAFGSFFVALSVFCMKAWCGMRLLPRSRKAGNGGAVVRG